MKVILCGYHWTGCKALELLLAEGHDVFVFTHAAENCVPDLEGLCRKKGVQYSTDKISAEDMPFPPDVVCSVYYRYLISQDVIDAVQGRIFNLHPSLLPKYRGCSSLTWAMINGECECGYTYHYIDKSCDTGDIIIQKKIAIEDFDTQLTLYNRVMFESMGDFLPALYFAAEGRKGIPQSGESSYYRRGCPYDGKIMEEFSGEFSERFIRAMLYPPYKGAEYRGREVLTYREYEQIRGGYQSSLICQGTVLYACANVRLSKTTIAGNGAWRAAA